MATPTKMRPPLYESISADSIDQSVIRYVSSSKNRLKLIYSNYVYEKRNEYKMMTYYRCERRVECQAKLNLQWGSQVMSATPHTHPEDFQRIRKLEVLNEIRLRAQMSSQAPNEIFQSVLNETQSTFLTKDQACRAIQRQRKRNSEGCSTHSELKFIPMDTDGLAHNLKPSLVPRPPCYYTSVIAHTSSYIDSQPSSEEKPEMQVVKAPKFNRSRG